MGKYLQGKFGNRKIPKDLKFCRNKVNVNLTAIFHFDQYSADDFCCHIFRQVLFRETKNRTCMYTEKIFVIYSSFDIFINLKNCVCDYSCLSVGIHASRLKA